MFDIKNANIIIKPNPFLRGYIESTLSIDGSDFLINILYNIKDGFKILAVSHRTETTCPLCDGATGQVCIYFANEVNLKDLEEKLQNHPTIRLDLLF
jgi:hypothetical protein